MAKKESLIGKTVLVNADALDVKGNAHPFAGLQVELINKTGKAYLAGGPDDTTAVLHDCDFELAGVNAAAAAAAAQPAADRIQVASLALYTDPAQNKVEQVDLQRVFESPFNPRTRFDAAALAELAETIKAVGVMQPVLARPVDMPITKGGQPVQALEIVFGHRRFRASKLAGVPTIPVIVRELTDAQSAQLQAIENVQRKDLDAVEEAIGYAHYIKVHGVTKDQLALEVGLSRTHVYNRLKLLNAVPAVHKACQAGEIGAEVALLIARIHTPKLQEKALTGLQRQYVSLEDGGERSYRKIRDYLREHFTLKLSEALFKPEDAVLLPDAGACTTCPKRTGNAPEFSDLAAEKPGQYGAPSYAGPNLCTDQECFDAKKKQHLANKAAELVGKGKTVITGGAARTAVGADGQVKGAYIALKDVKDQLAEARTKAQGNSKIVPPEVVSIQDPRTGKIFEAVRIVDLKAVGAKVKEPKKGSGSGWQEDQRRREQERKKAEAKAGIEMKVLSGILVQVRAAAAAVPRTTLDLQMVAKVTYAGVDWHEREVLQTLYGLETRDALEKKIGQMSVEQLTTLMLDCALVQGFRDAAWANGKAESLMLAAKQYGVDVAEIRKEITAKAPDLKTQDLLTQADSEEVAA